MLCQIATSPYALQASLQKPRLFAKAKKRKCMPLCESHAYSQKQQKHNWRPVTSKTPQPKRPSAPGEVVAVDQLVSPTPGLIAQMMGSLTKRGTNTPQSLLTITREWVLSTYSRWHQLRRPWMQSEHFRGTQRAWVQTPKQIMPTMGYSRQKSG